MPLVSVIIPVRNYERYIAAAIESVLAQKLTDYELIIVDDCSTDQTPEIVARYVDGGRIRLVRNETNLGQFPAHNRGAGLARGKYLKFLHGDDIMYPHCLEMMVALMEAFPDAGLGISYNPWPWVAPHLFSPLEAWRAHVAGQTGMFSEGPSGTVFRADAFRQAGGYDKRFRSGDCEMNLRMAMRFSVLLLPNGLWWYRSHDKQVVKQMTPDNTLPEVFIWYRELLSHSVHPFSKDQKFQAEWRLTRDVCQLVLNRLRRGKRRAAWSIWKSCGLSLGNIKTALSKSRACSPIPVEAYVNWSVFPSKASTTPSPISYTPPHASSLVSVLIPAYNAEARLAHSIESVMAQRFRNWELVIVDNASVDRTAEIARSYADGSRIRYFRNDRNLGKWSNYNRCVEFARGKYVNFLVPGDLYYPHAFQIMVSMMEHYGDAGLGVACEVGPYRDATCLSPIQVLRAEFFATPMLDCSLSATIIRRTAFDAVGRLEGSFEPCDRHLQLKLANHALVVRLTGGLIISDRHGGPNRSQCGTWPLGWAQGCEWLVRWILGSLISLPEPERRDAAAMVLRYLWKGGNTVAGYLPKDGRRGNRALALQLAREVGISPQHLRNGLQESGGWTAAMQEEERIIARTAPDLAAFRCPLK